MRYCITGGSGFIGRYFSERLTEAGHDITILDLVKPVEGAPACRYVEGDVRDPEACADAMTDCDRVVHLAAAHHDFGIEHDTYFDVNERGTATVCEAMGNAGIKDIVFYSTVAVYGDMPEPHHEDSPTAPVTPYGQSKFAGENVLRSWTEQSDGRHAIVVRPTVTFGPRNFANMYTLIDQINRGRFLLVGKGDNIKSLSYVENIIGATLYLLDESNRPSFDLVNFIDKPDLTSNEISLTVYEALGKKPWLRLPMWLVRCMAIPFDIVIALTGKNLPVSSARLKKMFSTQTKFEAQLIHDSGYESDVPLREGIKKMVRWYLKEGQQQEAVWHRPPAQAKLRSGK